MKAEKFGTAAKQARYKNSYLRPSELEKSFKNRCRTCSHSRLNEGARWRCDLIGYATAPSGWCERFDPMEKPF